ncbi:MAG: family 10 glycosylhydrolase, partial [Lachnospiraceae bacterium]|nr:family 10 glycosylhydrolase [Lachnospiraceae bacterium]
MKRLERGLTEIAVSLLFVILAMVLFGVHEKKTEEKPVKKSDAGYSLKRETDQEMRGVWVASVENLDYPASPTVSAEELRAQADTVLDGVERNGFNAVFLQVRPCSDAFYPSKIYPWSRYLTGQQGTAPDADFDPLEYWVSGAHKRGLELHAWINPYRIARDPAEWESLAEGSPARQHPDWVVPYGEGYYFNPALPEVRQLVIDGVMEIAENYQVDGIHLDDYFYPGADFNDGASYAALGADYPDIGDWRRNNVNLLVSGLDTAIHDAKPDMEFGISPSGIWASSTMHPEGSATTSTFSSYFSLYAD